MTAQPQLAYTVHPGKGPYLVLLHGFLSSAQQWLLNLQALAEVCTPVTIELWGHGDSPAPDDPEWYSPAAYVAQLERIRVELAAQAWYLCGYSLGAGLTIRYTHTYPQHVPAHMFTNSQSAFADAALQAEWRQHMPATAAQIRSGGERAIRKLAVHPRFASRLPEPVKQALNTDAKRLVPHAVAHTLTHTNVAASTRDIAASNPRPALLAFGQHEKRFHASKAWAADHMARLQIADLNAGHAVNMEDAPGFNQAITAFIRQHPMSDYT